MAIYVPHHYDMNLVFIDQLFTHFCYTGDTGFHSTNVAGYRTPFCPGEKEF